jgi:hypothetical protein
VIAVVKLTLRGKRMDKKICPIINGPCIEERCEFLVNKTSGLFQFVYDDKIERTPAVYKIVIKKKNFFTTYTEEVRVKPEIVVVTRIGAIYINTKCCKLSGEVKITTREFQ